MTYDVFDTYDVQIPNVQNWLGIEPNGVRHWLRSAQKPIKQTHAPTSKKKTLNALHTASGCTNYSSNALYAMNKREIELLHVERVEHVECVATGRATGCTTGCDVFDVFDVFDVLDLSDMFELSDVFDVFITLYYVMYMIRQTS